MTTEQRFAFARAARAWLNIGQREAAAGAGLGEKTLMKVELGQACSDKSWAALTGFYASRGIHWRAGDAGELGRLLVLSIDAPA